MVFGGRGTPRPLESAGLVKHEAGCQGNYWFQNSAGTVGWHGL
jgi:hypothetical protein